MLLLRLPALMLPCTPTLRGPITGRLIACSVCEEGYFEQFGLCKQCPSSKSLSALAMLAMACIVAVLGALAFKARHGLPVDVIKLGIST